MRTELAPTRTHHFALENLADWVEMRPFILLILIVSLAIAINFSVLRVVPPGMNTGETYSFWPIVQNVLEGRGFSICMSNYFPFCSPANQATAAREPLPIYLFAGIALLTGQSLNAAALVEMLIHILILLMIFFLTRAWANTHTALLAAFLWAVYLPGLKLVPQITGDLLATLGVGVGVYFVLRARRTRHMSDWIAVGVGLGIGILSRSAVLAVVPVLVLGLWLESWLKAPGQFARLKESLKAGVLILLVVLLLLAPWMIRNFIVFGRPVIGSTLTGYNLYRENFILGEANYLRFVGPVEADAEIQAFLARHPELLGTENEAQMDALYHSAAMQIITAHPVQYGILSLFRFVQLWTSWGVAEAYGAVTTPLDYAIMVLQIGLLVTALIGAWKTWKRSWPLWSSIIIFNLAYMAVIGQIRYLVPVMPLVISLSAYGCWYLYQQFFARRSLGLAEN